MMPFSFFYLGDERLALIRDGTQFVTRDGAHRWSKEELYHLAGEHPERFSNNVLTRPLMQEYLFPTLAFVGGPGEIAYWALLGQAFSQTGLQDAPDCSAHAVYACGPIYRKKPWDIWVSPLMM